MILQGEDKYKPALKEMWKLCFPNDTNEFVEYYFDKVYKNNETLVYIEHNQPLASLQIIPYTLKIETEFAQAGYISGAMTDPNYRKKGYMKKLLNASFNRMQEKTYDYAFLIPQEEWLSEFYAKYGFKALLPHPSSSFKPSPLSSPLPFASNTYPPCASYSLYSGLLMEKKHVVLKSSEQFSHILWDFFNDSGILFTNKAGMAFTMKEDDRIILKEFLSINEENGNNLLQTIANHYQSDKFFFPNENKGMIKKLNNSAKEITHLYLGMMLD